MSKKKNKILYDNDNYNQNDINNSEFNLQKITELLLNQEGTATK
jgi:hypothetical protein